MALNKMDDLRDHLFAALERLGEEEITADQLELEVKRSKAINAVAHQIIHSAKVEVDFLNTIGATKTESSLLKPINPKQID